MIGRTVTLPISDCESFEAGQIGPDSFDALTGGKPLPKYGVIIWYKDKELARQAMQAMVNTHWPESTVAAHLNRQPSEDAGLPSDSEASS